MNPLTIELAHAVPLVHQINIDFVCVCVCVLRFIIFEKTYLFLSLFLYASSYTSQCFTRTVLCRLLDQGQVGRALSALGDVCNRSNEPLPRSTLACVFAHAARHDMCDLFEQILALAPAHSKVEEKY